MPTARPIISASVGAGRGQRDQVGGQQQPAHADRDADDRRQQVHPGREQRAEGEDQDEDGDGDTDELRRADGDAGGPEGVAADGDLEPGIGGGGRGPLESVEARRVDLAVRGVVLDGSEGGPPVGTDRRAVERADHGVHLRGLCGRADDLLDDRGVGRIGHRRAVGGDEDDLCPDPRGAGRGGVELVERVLGLRAGDRELVVEGAAEGEQQGDDRAEDRQPGHRDHAAVAVGGATEPREK
jgi:hypothetical protein